MFFFQKRVNRQSWITRSSENQVNTQSQQCQFLLIDQKTVNIFDLLAFFYYPMEVDRFAADDSFPAAPQKPQELHWQWACSKTYPFKTSPEASAPVLS